MITYHQKNGNVSLHSPTTMPKACGFLWNKNMMIQMNCRGFATAQFMQPEPAKYAHGPALEAKTFMQPEHAYFSHHPGRFFYIKDNHTNELFSLPYEPVRQSLASFEFIVSQHQVSWQVKHLNLHCKLSLTLATEDTAELWQLSIDNLSQSARDISIYSYFPVGYMSWMNQSAKFDPSLNAILCHSITPYQKVDQYFVQQDFKDTTVFLTDTTPDSYETRQSVFEGEGGLHNPTAISNNRLENKPAHYQTPAAIMQFNRKLAAYDDASNNTKPAVALKFVFAPVKDAHEASELKQRYLSSTAQFTQAQDKYKAYLSRETGCLSLLSSTPKLDNFINHWLPRQVFYHGDVNRLSTDPQTRNYLQDAMGMIYINPNKAKAAFEVALAQQHRNGEMPDGILLHPESELKYINQIPHTDHCVWLVICIEAYLNETADFDFLNQTIGFANSEDKLSVMEHVNLALEFLYSQRDNRGLNFINQGDWCDPMNMVGYKGFGVSSWLTLASAYSMTLWAKVCQQMDCDNKASKFSQLAAELNDAVIEHCWDDEWFARGITDAGHCFGVSDNQEGRIYLNPQTFAMLSGAVNDQRWSLMQPQIKQQLQTPFGMMMLAPAYTQMDEQVGRLTQKFPGTAENGSVYNHAGAFYIYALFEQGETEQAFELLQTMITAEDVQNELTRGQLPVFIPNYYRGAYFQYPDDAGKSSQLFNTGTVAWIYRIIIEQLCGLKGCSDGLKIKPQLPKHWPSLKVSRRFRGATVDVSIQRRADIISQQVLVNGKSLQTNAAGEHILAISTNTSYNISVLLAV
ncbi:glycosyl hydrolase family 65 protein [Shewanella sp. 10N.286.51.B8]|uniref:GH36-type glycosyl hydrolase domain-containing protein n=1 Tax=Shewanella sp. 10N.286.51.B8 TaxID=3229708 RepID=UPI00354F6D7A